MIERADINSVLEQMRAMKSQAQQGMQQAPMGMPVSGVNDDTPGFGEMLKGAVDKVNGMQKEAKALSTSFERGDPGVDLHQVMISMEKASVSFEAMTQVRNRMVSAYEDVMKMPI
ncbi:flagellar hook-basal body complex protein FliE [Aliamphritea hakodatensis]|uniref:flagellar hook-basal body complex protein FliE n=1 Tax=Aliamphritea hakodatensis TaxID=2895352 RepID=UPI0022FD6B87|nr:flagellar hook-basal body complex protein FliE [Aliamphritea hakodatensis]